MFKMKSNRLKQPYVMGVPRLWFPMFFKFFVFALGSRLVASVAQKMRSMDIPYDRVVIALAILLLVLAYVFIFKACTLLQYRKMIKNGFIPCPLCGYQIEDTRGYRIGDKQPIVCSECGCATTTERAYKAWKKLLGKKAFRHIPTNLNKDSLHLARKQEGDF